MVILDQYDQCMFDSSHQSKKMHLQGAYEQGGAIALYPRML